MARREKPLKQRSGRGSGHRKPASWQDFFSSIDKRGVPDDFMADRVDPAPEPRPDIDAWFEALDRFKDIPFMEEGRDQPAMPVDQKEPATPPEGRLPRHDAEARRQVLEAVRVAGAAKATPGPSAARSQDFLFEEERYEEGCDRPRTPGPRRRFKNPDRA